MRSIGCRRTAVEVLWPNWIRHRSMDPEIAGSSPARIDEVTASFFSHAFYDFHDLYGFEVLVSSCGVWFILVILY